MMCEFTIHFNISLASFASRRVLQFLAQFITLLLISILLLFQRILWKQSDYFTFAIRKLITILPNSPREHLINAAPSPYILYPLWRTHNNGGGQVSPRMGSGSPTSGWTWRLLHRIYYHLDCCPGIWDGLDDQESQRAFLQATRYLFHYIFAMLVTYLLDCVHAELST